VNHLTNEMLVSELISIQYIIAETIQGSGTDKLLEEREGYRREILKRMTDPVKDRRPYEDLGQTVNQWLTYHGDRTALADLIYAHSERTPDTEHYCLDIAEHAYFGETLHSLVEQVARLIQGGKHD
jgi:hypothetical protein